MTRESTIKIDTQQFLDTVVGAVVGNGVVPKGQADFAKARGDKQLIAVAAAPTSVPPAVLHSDQGSIYSAAEYRELVGRYPIRQSMSRKGDCWDNAPMESFFHTLKTELVMHCDYKTRDQARYVECSAR